MENAFCSVRQHYIQAIRHRVALVNYNRLPVLLRNGKLCVEQLLLRAFVFAGVVVVKPDFAQCDSLPFAKQRCYMRKLAFTRI